MNLATQVQTAHKITRNANAFAKVLTVFSWRKFLLGHRSDKTHCEQATKMSLVK